MKNESVDNDLHNDLSESLKWKSEVLCVLLTIYDFFLPLCTEIFVNFCALLLFI